MKEETRLASRLSEPIQDGVREHPEGLNVVRRERLLVGSND